MALELIILMRKRHAFPGGLKRTQLTKMSIAPTGYESLEIVSGTP